MAQKSAHFLAQGSGGASWGAPCAGPGTIVVPVTNSSFVAYKKGSAVATASVGVAGPGFFVGTATQTIKITKQPMSYIDPLSRSAVRYRARLT